MLTRKKTLVLALSLTVLWGSFLIWKAWPTALFKVVFCDVGQGDAILISHGFNQLLIDTGPDSTVMSCLEENIPFWDRSLEFLVLTHLDKDHIGGAIEVLEAYHVRTLWLPLVGKSSKEFWLLRKAVLAEQLLGASLEQPILGQVTNLSPGAKGIVLWPTKTTLMGDQNISKMLFNSDVTEAELQAVLATHMKNEIDVNDGSIALLLQMDAVSILLMGDLGAPAELALMQSGLLTEVELLKVGHHGSKTSSTTPFINTISPETAVISAGKNNSYNHPDSTVLTTLEESGARIVRTDILGSITFLSDGQSFWQSEP